MVLAGGVVATGYSLLKTPQYQATSKAIISVASATSSSDLIQGSTYLQQVVSTYANVATTPYVLNPVIRQLKLPDTASQLANSVEATNPVGQTVIEITVTDRAPRTAAAISNAITQRLATAVQDLAPSSSNRSASVRVSLLQSAVPPITPSSPNVPLNIALGVVVGLLLGLVLAIVRARVDTSVTTAGDVERLTDHPVLGTVAFRRSAASRPLATDARTQLPQMEEFRQLRSRVLRATGRGRSQVVLVTSPTSGQGTSTTAANLAIAFSDVGSSVVLVDANGQHGTLDGYLDVASAPGLTDALVGTADVHDALQRSSFGRVTVMPAGSVVEEAEAPLRSARVGSLLDELRTRFQVVIIDAPPILTSPETLSIARQVDGVLLVAAVGRCDRVRLRRTLDDLDDAGVWVLGLVVTMTSSFRATRRRPAESESGRRPEPTSQQGAIAPVAGTRTS